MQQKQSLATQRLTMHVEPRERIQRMFSVCLQTSTGSYARVPYRVAWFPKTLGQCLPSLLLLLFSLITKSAPTVRARQSVISGNSTKRESSSLEQHYHKVKRSMVMEWWELWPNIRSNIKLVKFSHRPEPATTTKQSSKSCLYVLTEYTSSPKRDFCIKSDDTLVMGLGVVEGWCFTLIFDKIWSSAKKIHRERDINAK